MLHASLHRLPGNARASRAAAVECLVERFAEAAASGLKEALGNPRDAALVARRAAEFLEAEATRHA